MSTLAALLLLTQAPAAATPASHEPIASDWRTIPDDELLVMRLKGDRIVVIRLAAAYAPLHVASIRILAHAHWWDGLSVYRVQENWVAQWGDATEQKPLAPGVPSHLPPEFEIARFAPAQTLTRPDPHSAISGITADGWPVASDGRGHAWLTHCYGMVNVARDADPTSGSGAEMSTPIGQSARRLDRNYTVVGRIVEGMQYLSALPRSEAPLGVYATAGERTPILTARLASEMAEGERPRFQYRSADNPRFAAMVRLRENPAAPTVSLGGAAVCDVPLAVRRKPAG